MTSQKEKINKNTVPAGFSLGLAIYDVFPVLFFCISAILLGIALHSPLFLTGGVLCAWAGITKVIWKLIVVIKKKNIWWMFMQMRICMPIGFLIMIIAGIICRNKREAADIWKFSTEFPISAMFIVGFISFVLMGIAAAKLDSSDAKANWIEQTINTIGQFSILMGVLFLAFSLNYYKADEVALAALDSDKLVTVTKTDKEMIFKPVGMETDTGLIFYPGGKVEYTAYAPLMQKIAEKGITCVLVEMPMNYAIYDIKAADRVMKELPEVKNWYMAGHSLGGASICYYAETHKEQLSGVILLGAYSTKSLTDLSVLSIYGSEDGVMNRSRYEKNKVNLPADFCELTIKGGNHSMFGSYGLQDRDGKGTISPEEQWDITAEAIKTFILQ